ncbi:uncharacterized protein LOC121721311 isoform X1 [Alosa sapidissima]|uniref:uncharacterized protein LOC121721311 isoform X1 n=2 Tax=Alosa sapidissima TaxID=34773 RepID=UPI001C0A4412|nr:uncharacterized protein LOC121721311 isoform X1 [Alosa sapidissima]XP_041964085.1 uncharacterized protein LOC121721311 isoform X1 [Alosa sapidissima]
MRRNTTSQTFMWVGHCTRPACSAMFVFCCATMYWFPLVLLYVLLVYVNPQIFSELGDNVSISCRYSVKNQCLMNCWARVTMNGSLETVHTESEKRSRFSQSHSQDPAIVELNIFQTEMVDAGRYYCGMWHAGYFQFVGEGTSLLVEEKVWTNRSQVILLSDSAVLEHPLRRSEPLTQVELRCLVTGVSSPEINIVWRSSGGAEVTGRRAAWESTGSKEVFSVTSKLRINITTSKNTNYIAPDVLEEWWCEVQVGLHVVERSHITSLDLLSDHLTAGPVEWCQLVIYSAGALSVVCVCAVSLLISYWVLHLRKSADSSSDINSTATAQFCCSMCQSVSCQADAQQALTYFHLDFTQMRRAEGTPGRNQQKWQHKEMTTVTYSCVQSVKTSAASTTRRATSPNIQAKSSDVTYAYIDNEQTLRNARRLSDQPTRIREAETTYHTIKRP